MFKQLLVITSSILVLEDKRPEQCSDRASSELKALETSNKIPDSKMK